jgi:IS5 family transposase
MLRLYNDQRDLWEATLPPELQGLPPELEAMDDLLKDEAFLAPFGAALYKKVREGVFAGFEGRPSTPLASYVRLMVLKFRRHWSYEELLAAVNESVFLRRFCGFSLSDRLPHDTTLIKITGRLGEDFIKQLNVSLVDQARKRKIVKGRRMRVDTTVVAANIHYPTDTGLLGDGIRVIGRIVQRIKEQGVARAVVFRNRWRSAKKILRHLGRRLKTRATGAVSPVRPAKEKLVKMAQTVQSQARKVLEQAKGRVGVKDLSQSLAHFQSLLAKVIEQSQKVLAGQTTLPDRLVSLFDPEARPIDRGKLFPKTEFGYKALFQEAEANLVTDYAVFVGNPHDAGLLESAVDQHRAILGRDPEELATDRGFDDQEVRSAVAERIARVSVPTRGNNKDPVLRRQQKTTWFGRLQRWRSGGEATGSLLKRCYGWRRSLMRGQRGVATWVGYGVLAHNLWRMARTLNSS